MDLVIFKKQYQGYIGEYNSFSSDDEEALLYYPESLVSDAKKDSKKSANVLPRVHTNDGEQKRYADYRAKVKAYREGFDRFLAETEMANEKKIQGTMVYNTVPLPADTGDIVDELLLIWDLGHPIPEYIPLPKIKTK